MPGPESSLIGRSLLSALIYAIELLPRQRRAIFLAARLEEQSLSVVAGRFGVTTSKARNELRRAEAHCEQALLGNWAQYLCEATTDHECRVRVDGGADGVLRSLSLISII
ncbi:sigma factor-like helix-turn-helix DNA-binding protein [Alcaligenes faecalis]|uniref:sigma factor-like helix-turn-helix DNA-binding protein n=1 Tax=Alcaligenes faecalis TaxID=511 RepID=UPI001D35EF3F|nr:sigma factor-like helix-turn-helix DNA-binding protein [Alcaligenes faecalis]HJE65402.1 hypothetical protein [Alcaligenes faecalis]